MSETELIAENEIKSAVNGEAVKVKSLWENQDVVITFFRRFGCGFCRVAAKQISEIKPKLDSHNVRLVGIGVEDIGKEEFMERNFFTGDLYIDDDKKCYQALDFKRFGRLNLMTGLIVKSSRDAMAEVRASNLGGDLKGDYYQVGGTLVISKGGEKVLLFHKQQELADHTDPKEILKALSIE